MQIRNREVLFLYDLTPNRRKRRNTQRMSVIIGTITSIIIADIIANVKNIKRQKRITMTKKKRVQIQQKIVAYEIVVMYKKENATHNVSIKSVINKKVNQLI